MNRLIICFVISLFGVFQLFAQNHDWDKIAHASFPMFEELLALENDAHFSDHIEQNFAWIDQKFAAYGFKNQRLETSSAPLLLAEKRNRNLNNAKTILFYFHADGQPVDLDFWNQENAYQASYRIFDQSEGFKEIDINALEGDRLDRDIRIFARSASDDKGPIAMILTALELMKSEGKDLPYHLKIIFDFEEEISSPGLPSAVTRYRDILDADALVIYDGPMHSSNLPTVTYGARGIATMTITTYGPKLPQHSGHYGNYAPNPALRLSQLLSSMKDDFGRVSIPGFYDGIDIDEKLKEKLAKVPDNLKLINGKLGIAEADRVGDNYQEALQYPSLNIRGMASAWVGSERRTIVPSTATAEIDIRLVVESSGDSLISLVENHIAAQGYHIVRKSPTAQERIAHSKIAKVEAKTSYAAFRTDLDQPLGEWLYGAIKKSYGQAPIQIRTMGGSIPISPFIQELSIPAVIVPTVNGDNNQHSPNENIRLGNYIDGIRTFYAILTTPFD